LIVTTLRRLMPQGTSCSFLQANAAFGIYEKFRSSHFAGLLMLSRFYKEWLLSLASE
jgi:hypothetical protein